MYFYVLISLCIFCSSMYLSNYVFYCTYFMYLVMCMGTCAYVIAGAIALTTGFTNGVGRIWLDDVACVGTENRLIDCPGRRPIGSHNCAHFEDAGVRCQAGTDQIIKFTMKKLNETAVIFIVIE